MEEADTAAVPKSETPEQGAEARASHGGLEGNQGRGTEGGDVLQGIQPVI